MEAHIFEVRAQFKNCSKTDKDVKERQNFKKPKYLFKTGAMCEYCDTKLYSFRHINEHLSYEHHVHIELEELVFFITEDFKTWMTQMEERTRSKYEEYVCPISSLRLRVNSIPNKTFYRCKGHIKNENPNTETPLFCPSSLETYVEDGVLKVSFWRTHLCQINENQIGVQTQPATEMDLKKLPPKIDMKCNLIKPKPASKDRQRDRKKMLKQFTARVLRTDLTDVDPYFNDALDKVIPFLDKLLDKLDLTKRLKSTSKDTFLYFGSSSEESLSELEPDDLRRFSNGVFKRDSQLNGHEVPAAKKKKVNNGSNSNLNGGLFDEVAEKELFIHDGFDHVYT